MASILMKRGSEPLGVDTFPITQLDGLGARAARLGELVGLDAFTISAAIRGITETVDVRLLEIERAKATKDSKEEAEAVAIVRDDEPASDPVDGRGPRRPAGASQPLPRPARPRDRDGGPVDRPHVLFRGLRLYPVPGRHVAGQEVRQDDPA